MNHRHAACAAKPSQTPLDGSLLPQHLLCLA